MWRDNNTLISLIFCNENKALFCDFDGVFTDNSVFIDEEGKE